MDLKILSDDQKSEYNQAVTHVMQSWEWGEARLKLGLPLIRYGLFKDGKLKTAFQLTFHKIPLTSKYVGYLPKGPKPDRELSEALTKIANEQNCAFIKIEPDIENENGNLKVEGTKFIKSAKPLFTKHNFIIDLTLSEEELLKNMHPKTRYNIRVAERKGVKVEERIDDKSLETYLKLYFETTSRQGYHGHNTYYHKTIWETLKKAGMARLLIARYNNKPLTAWMLINFKDTLYYPYGGSSIEHKEVMSNNLVAWEAIKLGKKLGLKTFDMWGALGPNADQSDPWFGFHNFKKGYGGKLVEYMDTYDLIINKPLYKLFNSIDRMTKLKVLLLKILGK
jgi:lipid II:glycine glycyltransferase (peptidoglycan interpeptide bridge formation enzyme)